MPEGPQRTILLDEWQHPAVVQEVLPSTSATFQMIAAALVSRNASDYRAEPPNTHWSNWPDGGTL